MSDKSLPHIPTPPPHTAADGLTRHPLTALQRGTLTRSLLSPRGGHYIQQLVCEFGAPADPAAWQAAWQRVAQRHDSLRTRFIWDASGTPVQVFLEQVEPDFELVQVPEESAPDRARRMEAFLQSDRSRGFDLTAAPPWRVRLFRWPDHSATLVWTFHHALLDGRSHERVWAEVNRIHAAILTGTEPDLPPPLPFHEFLTWQSDPSHQPAAPGYWRDRMSGFQGTVSLPTLSLATDAGDDDGPPAMVETVLGADETAALRAAASRHGVTLNNLVQAAWARVLAAYHGVDEVTFGSVRACRHWTAVRPAERVGLFINTVPFRVATAPDLRVGEWLQSLRRQQLELRAGEHASIEQIRSWSGLPRGIVPFHTVVMVEELDRSDRTALGAPAARLVEKIDLPTLAAYAGDDLTLTLDYSPLRNPREQVRAVLDHVIAVLRGLACAGAGDPISSLSLMTAAERRRVLEEWQGRRTPEPASPIHRVLEAQAGSTPSAPAVEFNGEILSYADLHRRANRLARRLLQIAPAGERVVVILDRGHDQVVAWLAALKAGLVYAPIDPSSPQARLAFYLDDLDPAVVLTQANFRPHLPPRSCPVLALDDAAERAALDRVEDSPLTFEPRPEAPSSLLYTSGSTGTPKAAINSFGGLSNFASHLRRDFDLGPGDRVLQSSATSFDASLFDFVAALQSGGTLVLVASERLRPGPDFAALLSDLRISALFLTPTLLRSTPPPAAPAARIVFSGGEPLTPDLVAQWAPGRRLFNLCGPTECSIWYHFEECRDPSTRPVIGRLIENTLAYILDESLQPVPIGVPGELHLSGAGVGLGYWNRPELSREHFIPNPFLPDPSPPLYRTGDRVRWLADGRVEYLGRLDFQVKVHGVRVELGEIEAALRSHPAVADAVVVLHEDRLLAWLVAHKDPVDANPLRAWLAERLPLIFAPAACFWTGQFPRTRTGKADRARLLQEWLESRPAVAAAQEPAPRQDAGHRFNPHHHLARPYPAGITVLDLFREQVANRPEAPALKAGDVVVSYAELDHRSDAVAAWIARQRPAPEELVALRFPRSIGFVVAALGVLKAGGSYVPLEADAPDGRLSQILTASGARFLIADEGGAGTPAGWHGTTLRLPSTGIAPDLRSPPDDIKPAPRPSDTSRAYVIFTSGSTGQPKGVEIEHRSLANLVWFYRERLGVGPAARATLLANPVFDASVADLWPGLCSGATVLIPPAGLLQDPDALIAWLVAEGATFTFVPTPLGELLLQRPWPATLALRWLCLGGDEMHRRPPTGLPFSVINSYGPTENTVDATWSVVAPEGRSTRPPIGRPIANVRAYVLGPDSHPVPDGQPGELHLGGMQVARGYLHQPERTRERFLPDPWSDQPGARMYRTGDQVRWNEDGELEFLGRLDDQVQIRGQRVELGEIEAVLLSHPKVREACCLPVLDDTGVRGIEAHVAADDPGEAGIESFLRPFLGELLPAWMVPSRFHRHDRLPTNAQGKVDRTALRRVAVLPDDNTNEALRQDSVERSLARLWQRLLPESVGAPATRTFHELGGDSLQAVKLLLAVEELTGRRLALSTFLLAPTLAGLRQAVEASEHATGLPLLTLRSHGTRPPLFCLYELWGDVSMYFGLVDRLPAEHPVYAVRSPALHDPSRTPESIEAAARQVRGWIRQRVPTGEYGLIGYSWGGLLGFEIARQCAEEEGFNPFCALIGTQAPLRSPTRIERLAHTARWTPRWAARALLDHRHWALRLSRTTRFLREFRRNFTTDQPGKLPENAPPLAYAHIELSRKYQPAPARPVPILLFRERATPYGEPHPTEFNYTGWEWDGGWHRWTGCDPEVHWVEGDHWSVLKSPQVDTLAANFRPLLERHYSRTAP